MKLEDLLQSRRTMDYIATAGDKSTFEIAKRDYLSKLDQYHEYVKDKDPNGETQFKSYAVSERRRAEQLSLFNSAGPDYVDSGNNAQVRKGNTSDRSTKSANV